MSYELFTQWMDKLQLIDEHDRESLLEAFEPIRGISPKDFSTYTKKYYISHKPKPLLYQMFTFTTDPAKADYAAQEEYIKSILKRKENLSLTELWYAIEHKETNFHIHVVLASTKSIPPDAFKQYKKNWGSVQKSKLESSNSSALTDYLSKESKIIKLL